MKKKKKNQLTIVTLIVMIFVFFIGYKCYKNYQYKKSYEYKLLEKGYSEKKTEQLINFYNDDRLNYILTLEKNDFILNLITEKYYKDSHLKDYLEYQTENSKLDAKVIIRTINLYLNYNYYTHDITTEDQTSQVLVNKYYYLTSEYEPEDLVNISLNYAWGKMEDNKIRKLVYDSFIEMWNAAKNEAITLMINSSYRTYSEQEVIYNNYNETHGIVYADKIAARPGHSEHQTGYALDIFSIDNSSQKTFENSEAYKWLSENSYKYGFILRYPKGKEYITGYDFESWHYRYVGKDIAKYIYENDITFDEYYAYFIEK